jgi:hypothetical protein
MVIPPKAREVPSSEPTRQILCRPQLRVGLASNPGSGADRYHNVEWAS